MNSPRRTAPQGQLSLFQMQPHDPQWEGLSAKAQTQVIALLAQLLRDHHRQKRPTTEREVRDE